jgi:hypothetical protein
VKKNNMSHQKKSKIKNFFNSLNKKLTPQVLKDIHRPTNIPLTAHDCGWNHGKRIDKSRSVNTGENESESPLKIIGNT